MPSRAMGFRCPLSRRVVRRWSSGGPWNFFDDEGFVTPMTPESGEAVELRCRWSVTPTTLGLLCL